MELITNSNLYKIYPKYDYSHNDYVQILLDQCN